MSFGLFIFLIFAIWLVPKLVRGYMYVHRARSQMRDIYNQMYGGGTTAADDRKQRRRKSGWSAPARQKRKKIDPNVGEYVKFEEIKTDTTTTDSSGHTSSTHTVEQQVTDVEWVDL